jgi:hypothetical protein
MRPRTAAGIALLAGAAVVLAGAARALTPTDPQGGHPSYAQLGLPAAWEITIGSPEVVVAVVDTGVDPGHPDLAGAVRPGHDFVDDDGDAGDPPGFGHGTAVAGVAAARAGNGLGGVGACFRCSVLPLRVIGPDGFALNTNTAAAIDYAVDHGAAVVNASLYGPRSPKVLRDSIVRARSAGVLVVAAAGNEANSAEQYPAAFPEAIAVASATAGGPLASFSSRGDWVDFAAPECAPITALGGGFGVGCATSVSTPLVAGVVALLRAQAPFATAAELEAALASTARPVAGTRHGLVDAAAALARLGRPAPRLSPVILGEPVVGEELEAFSGVWSGAGLGVAYHWERCRESCDAIPGAAAPRYAPAAADQGARLRVVLSSAQAGVATSAATAIVGARPRLLARPSIGGRPRPGGRLVARRGTWAGSSLRYALQWLRCRGDCAPAGRGKSYRVRPRDLGFRVRLEVTASNALGAVTAASRPTAVVR